MAVDSAQHEQRDAFRVNDTIALNYVQITNRDKPAEDYFPELANLQALTDFKRIGLELQALLSGIDGATAQAIRLQEKRLEILAGLITASTSNAAPTEVSLSTTGLAFDAPTPIETGCQLALSMTFEASYFTLFTYAEVVRCEAFGKQWRLGCEFIDQSEADQQLLSRHIIAAQRRRKNVTGQ